MKLGYCAILVCFFCFPIKVKMEPSGRLGMDAKEEMEDCQKRENLYRELVWFYFENDEHKKAKGL